VTIRQPAVLALVTAAAAVAFSPSSVHAQAGRNELLT
jgi:hypothetical protein